MWQRVEVSKVPAHTKRTNPLAVFAARSEARAAPNAVADTPHSVPPGTVGQPPIETKKRRSGSNIFQKRNCLRAGIFLTRLDGIILPERTGRLATVVPELTATTATNLLGGEP